MAVFTSLCAANDSDNQTNTVNNIKADMIALENLLDATKTGLGAANMAVGYNVFTMSGGQVTNEDGAGAKYVGRPTADLGAVGPETRFNTPPGTTHWTYIDDVYPENLSILAYTAAGPTAYTDRYTVSYPSLPVGGVINNVRIRCRLFGASSGAPQTFRAGLRIGGTDYWAASQNVFTGAWGDYDFNFANNPVLPPSPWAITDIPLIQQVLIEATCTAGGVWCDQMYYAVELNGYGGYGMNVVELISGKGLTQNIYPRKLIISYEASAAVTVLYYTFHKFTGASDADPFNPTLGEVVIDSGSLDISRQMYMKDSYTPPNAPFVIAPGDYWRLILWTTNNNYFRVKSSHIEFTTVMRAL